MLHTVDDHAPIFDSNIAAFFFYEGTTPRTLVPQRIDEFAALHRFLADEYRRIIEKGLLAKSIQKFRREFRPVNFTDEKVIDSLIWGFVSLQKKGAAGRGEVVYC